jgi:hypothetical protein
MIISSAFYWHPKLTVLAAPALAIESLVFIWGAREVRRDHAHHHERGARPPHGVHRLRPDGPEPGPLTRGHRNRDQICAASDTDALQL